MKTFVEIYLEKDMSKKEIKHLLERCVNNWHKDVYSDVPLHEFLGFTLEQNNRLVEDFDMVFDILKEMKK